VEPLLIAAIAVGALIIITLAVAFVRRRALPPPEDRAELPVGGSLAAGLAKTRRSIGGLLTDAFTRTLDETTWAEIEDALVAADVGVATTADVVTAARDAKPQDAREAKEAVRQELVAAIRGLDRQLDLSGQPAVIVVVGVNGVGKTTTIAKLARDLKADGKSVLLGAADTFRAAADSQLRTWAHRVGADIVSGEAGGDPASVAFDSYAAGVKRGIDVVIIDTAGRLHSKSNLMAELSKISKVVAREAGRIDETLLVLDATTGQNGIAQARQFLDAVDVSGVVLTKMDGSAKGGVVIAIERELGIPVKLVGVGEGMDDLIGFEPESFVEALLGET